MGDLGKHIKDFILNFKLDLCCFVFSVRVGTLIIGYYEWITSFVSLILVAEEGIPPLLAHVHASVTNGEAPIKYLCVIAYSIELASSMVLLCGVYRSDLVLLRMYQYYAIAVGVSAFMVYSMVLSNLGALVVFLIILNILYQIYLVIIVRSMMVEIKQASTKNGYTVQLTKDLESGDSKEKFNVIIESEPRKPILAVNRELPKPAIESTSTDKENSKGTIEKKYKGTNEKYDKGTSKGTIEKNDKGTNSENDKVAKDNIKPIFSKVGAKDNAKEGSSKDAIMAQVEKDRELVVKPTRKTFFGRKVHSKDEKEDKK